MIDFDDYLESLDDDFEDTHEISEQMESEYSGIEGNEFAVPDIPDGDASEFSRVMAAETIGEPINTLDANFPTESITYGEGYWATELFDAKSLITASVQPEDVIGDPWAYLQYWRMQPEPGFGATTCQNFILSEQLAEGISDEQLSAMATDAGWQVVGAGTPIASIGNLLEFGGLEVEYDQSATLDDLAQQLAEGRTVIAAVSTTKLWAPSADDDNLGDYQGIPGQQALGAVQVIGIDRADAQNPVVILNDPGLQNGSGIMISAEAFIDAWNESGGYMVSATGAGAESSPLLAGGYNKWGYWQYDDGTWEEDFKWGHYYNY
ncbi:MAG: hypothetical protein JMN24_13150 [gamma proteobacterium endosymbiont of Lamellibrachia anaximandri]|nr:hypothetical protein [gamma proteobacterium endosymbiont of Lamellibrachia anaximandri]MBL3598414.1 hypothetical protein [gamma proteobacterium endosymbiont of Lamellibrachia anaximandri]MBL3616732.1 hypothetical protein [gamma proteobacterium endosymbiont of Lamellibrachia anaximandri]